MEEDSTNGKPSDEFFHTEIYEKAKDLLKKDKSVLYLHGLSGSGKTVIAKTLAAEYGENLLINCIDMHSIKNDVIDICNKENLDIEFPANCRPLDRFLDSVVKTGRFLILDDVEDSLVLKTINRELYSTKIIVTTQKNVSATEFHSYVNQACQLKVEGFTKEEAKKYLRLPDDTSEDLLKCISTLPVALRAFKSMFDLNRLDTPKHFIKRYIAYMGKVEKNAALRCISDCLKRALAANTFYQTLVKHLSMFSHKDITDDILVALVEELGESNGYEVANHFVNCLDNQSICDIRQSDTGKKYVTTHSLVKKAMESLVETERYDDVIRLSLQAFSRIMPLDGRHYQYFLLPRMLEHGLSLCDKMSEVNKPSLLTQLLHGQLLTSIGYCMLSHRHDIRDVINILNKGWEVFQNLITDLGYRSLEDLDIDDVYQSRLVNNKEYLDYISTLQRLHRVTPKDFNELFKPEKYSEFHENLIDGHLTENALRYLLNEDLLLKEDMLAKIYPWEVIAFHLHMLSRAYKDAPTNENLGHQNAVDTGKKAAAIYLLLEQKYRVPLLRMYVNKRDLLALQNEDGFDDILRKWKELQETRGKAYECGMVRIRELQEDGHHKLQCLLGQLDVCGRKAKVPGQKESAVRESKDLITQIDTLSKKHEKNHITLCKSYLKIAKFFESAEIYCDAIKYLIRSMMEYHEDCLETQEDKSCKGHPELDDDKIKKFVAIYDQIVHCIGRYRPHKYRETERTAVEYLTSLDNNWQLLEIGKGARIAQADEERKGSLISSLFEVTAHQASE